MVARQFHRLEVLGSNPSPATQKNSNKRSVHFILCFFFPFCVWLVCTAGGCHLFLIYLECIRNKRISVVDSFTSKPSWFVFLATTFYNFFWLGGRAGLMRQIANLLTGVIRSGGSNPLPIVLWRGRIAWLSAEVLKTSDRDERSVGSNPTPVAMVDIV